MAYSLYRMEFTTGLHIGTEAGGPSLDNSRMTIPSDTLFSALCCECVKNGRINDLYQYFNENFLSISDALPYKGDEFFLPKPVLFFNNKSRDNESTNASLKKEFKSIEYIPLSSFNKYMKGLSSKGMDLGRLKYEFGKMVVDTRAAIKGKTQTMPYNVAYWRFNEGSGLYVIVGYQNDTALSLFEEALVNLGLSGVGGKQSSGLGKFNVRKCSVPSILSELLNDKEAEYQMLLGTALPGDQELDTALIDGWYKLIRRGGFIRSETYSSTPQKKRTIHMLMSGSCLRKRFDGEIFNLSNGGVHPVWRCGKTLFAGVRL